MADVPAVCEVPLTRAVVQYREEQDRSGQVPTVDDVGLALVLDGDVPARSSCVDLGSGVIRTLDLGSQIVVLDWLYDPTLVHLRGLLQAGGDGRVPGLEARRYCGEILHRILARTGFGPLARPTLLRLGFRDVARDLDPHEGAAVRILLGPSRVARIRLDPDNVRLVVATGSSVRDGELEAALSEAFPLFELRRVIPSAAEGTLSYLVLLQVPAAPGELHALLDRVRKGIGRIMARFEPERLVGVEAQLSTFGVRDTLSHLDLRDPRGRSEPIGRGSPASGPVH